MTTPLGLVNSALVQLGDSRLTSFDDGTTRADVCREEYQKAVDTVLEIEAWNFATTRDTFTQIADDPPWGWTYRYAFPVSPYCLRVLELQYNQPFDVETYQWQGNPTQCVVTDAAPCNARFIHRVDDLSRWSGLAIEALTIFLGKVLAPYVTGQQTRREAMITELKQWLAQAVDRNAREGTPAQVPPNRYLVGIRHAATVRNPERNGGVWP